MFSLSLQSYSLIYKIRVVIPCSQDARRSSKIMSMWRTWGRTGPQDSLVPFLSLPLSVVPHCSKKTRVQEHGVNLPCYSGSLVSNWTKTFSVIHSSYFFFSFLFDLIFIVFFPLPFSSLIFPSPRQHHTSCQFCLHL